MLSIVFNIVSYCSRFTTHDSRFTTDGKRLTTHNSQLTFFTIIWISVITIACHITEKSVSPKATATELKAWDLKYQRGPCFGQCPVYAFYLLSDHTGLVNVHANLLDPGWYEAPLDQEAVDEILMLLEPEDWWHEDLSDEPEIADLALLNLTYLHTNGIRNLTVQNKISASLIHVFEKINHLIEEGRWVPTNLRPYETPEEKPTEVLVHLKDGVDIQEWMKKFDQFGIQLKRRFLLHDQYYIVAKDPELGYSSDFLQYIKLDRDVINAQWDLTIQKRN